MDQIYNSLTKLIQEHDNIMIMTHKYPDFDGIGSALSMQSLISSFNKQSFIIKGSQEKNKSLDKAYNLLNQNNIEYNMISKNKATSLINDNTLLIILDTHKASMLEDSSLLEKSKNVVVIDHHIKSKEYIKDSKLTYINSNLSSTVEFVVNYLKYLNKEINNFYATFMLVGLEIDTNNFKLKTTDTTYETAAILIRMGADNILKQELLQETKTDYLKRQKIIEKSTMITDNMALCVADTQIYQKQDLAAIAEELLQFENVEASFAIGKISSKIVGISARSIGKIDVEEIMAKLGGGGHLNEAATQLECSISEAERQLVSMIGDKQ